MNLPLANHLKNLGYSGILQGTGQVIALTEGQQVLGIQQLIQRQMSTLSTKLGRHTTTHKCWMNDEFGAWSMPFWKEVCVPDLWTFKSNI